MELIENQLRRRRVSTRGRHSIGTGNNNRGNDRKIFGGIGTVDGRIWVVYENKRVVSKAIIKKESDTIILSPRVALRNLERGPTGHHNILMGEDIHIEMCYCHQKTVKLESGCCIALFGRTFLVNSDDEQDDDASDQRELLNGEHLSISCGTVKIRVSSAGHRIYIDPNEKSIKFQIIKHESVQ